MQRRVLAHTSKQRAVHGGGMVVAASHRRRRPAAAGSLKAQASRGVGIEQQQRP